MSRAARVVDFGTRHDEPVDALGEMDVAIEALRKGGAFALGMRDLAGRLLDSDLAGSARALMRVSDLDRWIAACGADWGQNALYPTWTWPADERSELGLVIALIERFAREPSRALDFVDEFHCIDGDAEIRLLHLVEEVIVPFGRHYREFVMRHRKRGAPIGAAVIVCGDDDQTRRTVCERLTEHAFDVQAIGACAAGHPEPFLAACPANDEVAMAIVILGPGDLEARWLSRPAPGVASPGLLSLILLTGRLGADRVTALASTALQADWSGCLVPPLMITPDPGSDWASALLDRIPMGVPAR